MDYKIPQEYDYDYIILYSILNCIINGIIMKQICLNCGYYGTPKKVYDNNGYEMKIIGSLNSHGESEPLLHCIKCNLPKLLYFKG